MDQQRSKTSRFHPIIGTTVCFDLSKQLCASHFFLIVTMPARVTPNEASVQANHEMTSSISVQPTTSEVSFVVESILRQENGNERLLRKAVNEIYSPVLKLMSLFGIGLGKTSLESLELASGCCGKLIYLQRIYCGVVVSGLWLNFCMSLSALFLGASFFLFLQFSLWCLVIALNGSISLIVLHLHLKDTRKSRFEHFLRGVLAIKSNFNLEKVITKSRKGIIVFTVFFITAYAGVLGTQLAFDINISNFMPWNQWYGFRIISALFLGFGCGVWFLPIFFLYVTCLILEEMFDELHKRMSSLHSASLNLAALKKEHHTMCELVELADKMSAPLLLAMISVYIPLICVNFYHAVMLPLEGNAVFLISNLSWLMIIAGIFAVIMFFGSNLNEKV